MNLGKSLHEPRLPVQGIRLTSFALIREFPLLIVIIDLAWGIALTTVVSGVGYWAATR